MTISYTVKEIEEDRLESLNEKLFSTAYDMWQEKYIELEEEEEKAEIQLYLENNKERVEKEFLRNVQPGTFYCHEAIEAVSHSMDDVARYLMEHPSIIADPDWYKMAHEAHTILFNLYQAIGDKHLEAIPDNIVELIELNKVKKNLE